MIPGAGDAVTASPGAAEAGSASGSSAAPCPLAPATAAPLPGIARDSHPHQPGAGPRSCGYVLTAHSTNEESFMSIGKRPLPNTQGLRESHPAGNSCFIRCWKVAGGRAGVPVSGVGAQRSLQAVYRYTQGKYTGKSVSDSQCVVPLNSISL